MNSNIEAKDHNVWRITDIIQLMSSRMNVTFFRHCSALCVIHFILFQ